jgi:hypothetical protein
MDDCAETASEPSFTHRRRIAASALGPLVANEEWEAIHSSRYS